MVRLKRKLDIRDICLLPEKPREPPRSASPSTEQRDNNERQQRRARSYYLAPNRDRTVPAVEVRKSFCRKSQRGNDETRNKKRRGALTKDAVRGDITGKDTRDVKELTFEDFEAAVVLGMLRVAHTDEDHGSELGRPRRKTSGGMESDADTVDSMIVETIRWCRGAAKLPQDHAIDNGMRKRANRIVDACFMSAEVERGIRC